MKNKGFTLVELLAVLVILAVLGLVTVPLVSKTISDSKKKAGMASAQSYLRAAEQYVVDASNDEIKQQILYSNPNIFNYLTVQGSKAKTGRIYLDDNNDVGFFLLINDYCYIKQPVSEDISIQDKEGCVVRTPIEECFDTEESDDYDGIVITGFHCGDTYMGITGSGFDSSVTYDSDGEYSELEIPESIHGIPVVEIGRGAFSNLKLEHDLVCAIMADYSRDNFDDEELSNNLDKKIKANMLASYSPFSFGVKKVKIPSTIKRIDKSAFWGNELESIELPEGLEEIEYGAFEFNKLKSFNLPSTVIYLDGPITNGNLISDDQAYIFYREDYNDDGVITNDEINKSCIVGYGGNNKDIVLPDSAIYIEDSAFEFVGLNSITFGNNIDLIGEYAFYGNNLKTVNIPNSITEIDDDAFQGNPITEFNIDKDSSFNENSPWGLSDASVIHYLR